MAKSDKELEEMEKGWDIWQEVLESVGEIQAGKGKKVSMTLPAAAGSGRLRVSPRRSLPKYWGFRSGPCKTGSRAVEDPRSSRRPFSK